MSRHLLIFCQTLAIGAVLVTAQSLAQSNQQPNFQQDVLPILSDKCFHCHGPDASTREADLRLDVEESVRRTRDDHAVVVPGDSAKSELVARIMSRDPDLVMPPADSDRTLTETEKQTLIKWIDHGAEWKNHWSFVTPTRPALPRVKDHQWPRNAIDRFVLHEIEMQGLSPSVEADRAAWLRRVTFDLTGLPPTLDELDEFLSDEDAAAFERVVDRLLASPRYGEHMAVSWLDAARYADTDGYQNDGPREMWRWRDWVIDAYNQNMPFDQFTIEQLAGDLMPDASLSQIIATGFNRNHRYNSEAGIVLEEFLLENAVDRVDTTSTVWMGLTMGCARCHDHKFDPFSQAEYYQLISFFNNITECGRAIKFGNSEPWITAPTDQQQQQLDDLNNQIQNLEHELASHENEIENYIRDIRKFVERADIAETYSADESVVSNGLKHYFPFEDMQAEGITVQTGGPVLREGFRGNSGTVGGNGILALGKVGDIACQTRSSISFWLKPEKVTDGVILSRQASNTRRPGFSVEIRDGHLQFYIITRWVAGVGAVETVDTLHPDEWVHIALTNDGSQRARGMHIWINGQLADTTELHNTNSNTGGTAKDSVLRFGGGVHGTKFKGQLDELRFYDRTLFDDEIQCLSEPASILQILAIAPEGRTPRMTAKLLRWILGRNESSQFAQSEDVDSALDELRSQFQQLIGLRTKRIRLLDSFPTTMVMEERHQRTPTHVRIRGVYHQHGEQVTPEVPATFPAMPEDYPRNRLGFAKWLVSGYHPLTARVIVNRDWQRYFGIGLVRTAEDFGLQGELPTHPELLDWLAVEFAESGWDVKALQKLIVLSATYRQSSAWATDTDNAAGDPENRWLARGPRLRLSARQLRDQALFASGLMTPDIGGPSVSPYQPAGLWAEMSNMRYRQSKGKDLYRRGLYTIWKRTVAPPGLAILDAADRENCVVRPKRTNTPLQALTLLNETTFVEAARHLAARMLREGDDSPIDFAFRTVLSRHPTDAERSALNEALDEYKSHFLNHPKEAEQLLSVGESVTPKDVDQPELAAATMVCNIILNLDEALTK